VFDLIISIANSLASLGGQLRSIRRDEPERIADLLTNISECTADIAGQFRASREVPYDRCFELQRYMLHLRISCDRIIEDKQLSDLISILEGAERGPFNLMGRLHVELALWRDLGIDEADAVKENALRGLDYATGSFRATANLLRAS